MHSVRACWFDCMPRLAACPLEFREAWDFCGPPGRVMLGSRGGLVALGRSA